jgi:hypothetical protein
MLRVCSSRVQGVIEAATQSPGGTRTVTQDLIENVLRLKSQGCAASRYENRTAPGQERACHVLLYTSTLP